MMIERCVNKRITRMLIVIWIGGETMETLHAMILI